MILEVVYSFACAPFLFATTRCRRFNYNHGSKFPLRSIPISYNALWLDFLYIELFEPDIHVYWSLKADECREKNQLLTIIVVRKIQYNIIYR